VLLDAHGAAFATPSTETVQRHVRLSSEERVAFFEVVPKRPRAQTSSLAMFMWPSNFLSMPHI